MAKRKGQRVKASDLFNGKLQSGAHVLLGGTYASYPAHWYVGQLLWVGDEEVLIHRSTEQGQTYTQQATIYAIRAVGDSAELLRIKDAARKAVADLMPAIHDAEQALGNARAALHAKLTDLQCVLSIEAFDREANAASDAAICDAVETIDAEQLASEAA